MITSTITDEFRSVTTEQHREALDELLSDPTLPTDRGSTWHVVASVLLATGDGRVLLARNRRGWGTVGGHVEPADPFLRATVVREARKEKTHTQRKLFHALCKEAGDHIGLTKGKVKAIVKD